jgi:SAM-dependent methyltransferase
MDSGTQLESSERPGSVEPVRPSQLKSVLGKLRTVLDVNFTLRRQNLLRLREHLRGDLLELGVGEGPDQEFLRTMPGVHSYQGCDREEYSETYRRGSPTRAPVRYYRGEVLPFADASFDTAVSLDCIEHIRPEELPGYLAQIHRVLRPGGRLLLSAPFVYPEHCMPYDYQRFTRSGLLACAQGSGLEPVVVTSRSTTLESLLVVAIQRFFNSAFPFALASRFGSAERSGAVGEGARWALVPLSTGIYLGMWALAAGVSRLPGKRRDLSPFSLGYTCVLEKARGR